MRIPSSGSTWGRAGEGGFRGDGAVLGLVGAEIWTRPETKAKGKNRKGRRAEDKESRRWLAGAQIAAERLDGATQDRTLLDDRRLKEVARDWPVLDTREVEVAAKRVGAAGGPRAARAAVGISAAVRNIQLVDARHGSARPATDVIDGTDIPAAAAIGKQLEGATKRQQNPHARGTLAWLSWIVARLGGWNCYYRPPGPKTMANGWNRLADRLQGFVLARRLGHV